MYMRTLTRLGAVIGIAAVSWAQSPLRTQTIWFCPHDPALRPDGRSGSVDYMSLFSRTAPWPTAAARVQIFKIYASLVFPDLLPGTPSQDDVRNLFSYLNSNNIALAVEWGPLVGDGCGAGIEGFAG